MFKKEEFEFYRHKYKNKEFTIWISTEELWKNIKNINKELNTLLENNIWINLCFWWESDYHEKDFVWKIDNRINLEKYSKSHWNKYEYISKIAEEKKSDKLIFLEKNEIKNKETWEIISTISDINIKKIEGIIQPNRVSLIKNMLEIVDSTRLHLNRIHIVWNKRNNLLNEIFTLEWTWTLILYNIDDKNKAYEVFQKATENDFFIIYKMISPYFWKWIRERSYDYIYENINNYFIYKLDWVPAWCIERIPYWWNIIEMWSVAILDWFSSMRLWKEMIDKFLDYYRNQEIFAVSSNKRLIDILYAEWFTKDYPEYLENRIKKSPKKQLFYKKNKKYE